jgi:curved DNA-binding protein CbpA
MMSSFHAVQKLNLYEILAVADFCDAEEVKRGFRRMVLRLHPDRAPLAEDSALRFRRVVEAYTILRDPAKRQEHDRQLRRRLASPVFEKKEFLRQRQKTGKRHYSPEHERDEEFLRFVEECRDNFLVFLRHSHRVERRPPLYTRHTMPQDEFEGFVAECRDNYREFFKKLPRIGLRTV